MAPSLDIIKIPRSDPIPDIPISFPPLENLHLEHLEIKKKLLPGVPLIPIVKRDPPKPKKEPKKQKSQKLTETNDGLDEPEDPGDDDVLEILGDKQEDDEELDEGLEEEEATELEEPEEQLSPEELEKKEKEEYIWRFRILKKQNASGLRKTQVEIPDYNEHSDLRIMKQTYDRTVKELYLDEAVDSYKMYLAASFMVVEFGCTTMLGVDMQGFALQQASMMYKYDRYLIELGEKSCNSWSSNMPVEVRLVGFVLIQAVIFFIGKKVTEQYGGNYADIFRCITGQPPAPEKPKEKRMRGPKISPDEIRNMSREKKD